jgi:hypothetical protein
VRLEALTCVTWSAVVEVPADFSEADLEDVVSGFAETVDSSEYEDDPTYWEEGECGYEVLEVGEQVPVVEYVVDEDFDCIKRGL